jgi:TolA-binding protein
MRTIALSIITASTLLFASPVDFNKIDPNKTIIQIGVYSEKKNLQKSLDQVWSKRDTFIKKGNGLSTLYAVNIDKNIESKVLNGLQSISKDAFINKSGYKRIQGAYLQNNNDLNNTINTQKTIIQMGVFSQRKSLDKLTNKLNKKYNTQTIEEDGIYRLLVVNIDIKNKYSTLKKLRKISKDAFFYTKPLNSNPNKNRSSDNNKQHDTQPKAYLIQKREQQTAHSTQLKSNSLSDNLYQEGLQYFKNKDYKNAQEIFLKVYKQNSTNEKNLFYLGRSEYELGLYENALRSYKVLLENKPDNPRILLETAQTYFKLKKYNEALEYFNATLQHKLPPQVKNNIQKTIFYIQNKMINKVQPINTTLSFGLGYDTNIENTTDVNSYNVYIPQINSNFNVVNNTKKEKGSYGTLALASSLTKQYNDRLLLNTSAQGYSKNYVSENEENIQAISINVTPNYLLSKKDQVSLGAGYDHIWYGGDSFLDIFSVTPGYRTMLNESLYLNTNLKFGTKKYKRSIDKNRDADFIKLETSLIQPTKLSGIFQYGFTYNKEKEKNSERTDVSKNSYKLSIGHKYDFAKQYALNTSLSYENISYKDTDINFLTKRDDSQYNLSLGLAYFYSKELLFSIRSLYIKNNSNHNPFNYDKFDIMGNVTYRF